MQSVSERWLASLGLARWVPRVEWSPDVGVHWLPLTVHDGSVQAASTSQVRWSADLTCSGADLGRHGLTPYGGRIRVFQGLAFDRFNIEEVPLGMYRVEDIDQTGVRTGRFTVKGASLEAQVIDARFQKPRVFLPDSAPALVRSLIQEVLPTSSLHWGLDGGAATPALTEDRDRWGLIDGRSDSPSIAKSLGGRVFCDARGSFVAAPVPSLDDPPVWTVDTGPGGALVEPSRTLSRAGVYNQVVASGATDDGTPPIGPAVASDTDPGSPTYYLGPFGQVPLFYTSRLLRTLPQAQDAARGMLAPLLGLKQTVTLSTLANFALAPDDVIRSRMPDGTLESHVVDSLSYPLTGGSMSLTTRSTTTRLAGQITVDQETDSGAGDINE